MSSPGSEVNQLHKFLRSINELGDLHDIALAKLNIARQSLEGGEQKLDKLNKICCEIERKKDTALFNIERAKETIAETRQQLEVLDSYSRVTLREWEDEKRLHDDQLARMTKLRGLADTAAKLEKRARDTVEEFIQLKRRRVGVVEAEERRDQLAAKVSTTGKELSEHLQQSYAERKEVLADRIKEAQTVLRNTTEDVDLLNHSIVSYRSSLGTKRNVRLMVREDLAGNQRAVQGLLEEKRDTEEEISSLKRKQQGW